MANERSVAEERRLHKTEPVVDTGRYVLYWMRGARRFRFNRVLQQALWWAEHCGVPLVIAETLTCGHRWDTARHHTFIMQGMEEKQRATLPAGVLYRPLVERQSGEARQWLVALAADACLTVTDWLPLRSDQQRLAEGSFGPLDVVDDVGLYPIRLTEKDFISAYQFRRHLQKFLPPHLLDLPLAEPFTAFDLPSNAADLSALDLPATLPPVEVLPVDQSVAPVALQGGEGPALERLTQFVDQRLARYLERNHPAEDAASGLSPYLHHGFIAATEVFAAITAREQWTPDRLAFTTSGKKSGWWGMSGEAEAFLDELITWRELGFNFCFHRSDYDRLSSLPDWVRKTLNEHAADERSDVYALEQFDQAQTGDPLWNAAQKELTGTGKMQNYLRMLWGKKIFEWSLCAETALETMIELNNRYALDGRDPNSYSGIFWCLGRYDRAWAERPVYGKIRYMTSASTLRKLNLGGYLEVYGQPD